MATNCQIVTGIYNNMLILNELSYEQQFDDNVNSCEIIKKSVLIQTKIDCYDSTCMSMSKFVRC